MLEKIKNKIINMSEITKTRLFAVFVIIIMISGFCLVYENKSNNTDSNYNKHRYYKGY